ncbi:hypothetical protein D3C81_1783490 [compost metagenome]
MLGVSLGLAVQELVRQLLETLEAQVGAAQHQQRRHRPGDERTDQQRRRHQDGLVHHRALGHSPHHRDLALGTHPGDLLGIQRQVIAQHACGLFRRHLGHHRDVIEHRGDVVDQYQ